jgi:hypothetical protein
MSDQIYFAADEIDKKVSYLVQKGENWFNGLKISQHFAKIRTSWEFYHGFYYNSSHTISYGGEIGEYVQVAHNHYRNIADHIIKMITANRPSFQARATNIDVKSQMQVNLANGLLEYYMREKKLERVLRTAVEYAVIMSAGFIKMEWNPMAGDVYDYVQKNIPIEGELPENEQDLEGAKPEQSEPDQIPIFEGDVRFTNLTPYDVVYDVNRSSFLDQDWVLVRTSKNKYDLAAQFPELRDRILSAETKDYVDGQRVSLLFRDDTSDIYVYEFFHKKTPALPQGNYCLFLDSDCVMVDSPLPYRELPVYRISYADILGTPYSYSTMFDLMPIQQELNGISSTIMTNINAHGIPNIISPREAGIKLSHVEGGMNFIEYDATVAQGAKPEALKLLDTAPEVYRYLEKLEQEMETLSAISSVVRGDPQASLKSGSALALIQSQTIQFMSGLQQSYIQLIEDVGTGLINILRDFAHSPRIASIAGVSNKSKLRYFTGDDISLVNRVVVDAGNALAATPAGRLQIASDLIQMGLITSPEQYLSVLNTGRLETLTQSENDELMLVKDENERIISGDMPIMAAMFDKHSLHIREHRAVAADTNLRMDPGLMKRLNDHIQEHLDLAASARPDLMQYLHEPQFAPPQGPPPGPPGNNVQNISQPPVQKEMNPEPKQAKMPQPAQSPNKQPTSMNSVPLSR